MITLEEMDPVNILLIFIILSVLLFISLFLVAYKIFFSRSTRHDYSLIGDDVFGFGDVPREFINDEETLSFLADEFDFTNLSPEEQQAYLRGEEFSKTTPPNFNNTRGKSYTHEDDLIIKDCGLNAFEFEQDEEILNSRYIVADKTEIHFINNDSPYSTATSVLNYSLPVKNRTYSDTIYFETKVFEYDSNKENSHFAIGLVTKPYPSSFRLPGYNNFSIAYESTGNLKINKPFPTPLQQHMDVNSKFNAQVLPPLQQSDVVGFGYVVPTGTIFITRNGKKVMDVIKDCFIDLYPAVGCFLTNAKFQVNIGQLGYVWIEANVRKYGFISTSDYKKIGGDRGLASLPQYGDLGKQEGDKLLDKGEELPPDYPEDELDFFGRSTKDIVRFGSSSKNQGPNNEKNEELDDEVKPENASHSVITDEPEELMDLRERLYEQNTDATNGKNSESVPILSGGNVANYSSFEESDSSQQKEPLEESATSDPAASSTGEIIEASSSTQPKSSDSETESPETTASPEPANKPTVTSSSKKSQTKKKKKKSGKKKSKRK